MRLLLELNNEVSPARVKMIIVWMHIAPNWLSREGGTRC